MTDNTSYQEALQKEAEIWGRMAQVRWQDGIPLTMDFQLATRYRVKREVLGWGDYIQDPKLEALTPFGAERKNLIEYAMKAEGKNALDLCCGAGFLSLELARAGKDVDAIDLSSQEIDVAKKYQRGLKSRHKPTGNIHWIVADLNHFELPKEKYDIITAWDGLHHIINIEALCEKIHAALKPGGVFLFSERVWGGKQRSMKTKISQGLEITVNVCLPLAWSHKTRRESFRRMLRIIYHEHILRKNSSSADAFLQSDQDLSNQELISPFEDAIGKEEILGAIQKRFIIEKMHHFGAFSEEACRSLLLPRFIRIPAVLLLSWFDYFWVRTKLLEGKLVLGYARKGSNDP